MKHSEVTKKLKKINTIQKEWRGLNELINTLQKWKTLGDNTAEEDLEKAIRRQKRIENELDNLLK